VLSNLGIIAHKQDQHVEAIQFFQGALLVFPEGHGDQSSTYTNMGASYQAIGDNDKAINAYQKVIELNLCRSDKAKV
jgi:tetratricopeptide (TPR) repeat protein